MCSEIIMLRHEQWHNKYLLDIVRREDTVNIIQSNTEAASGCEAISSSIMNKEMLAFSLSCEGKIIGFASIVDIDWENRNGRLKTGIFGDFAGAESSELMREGIKEVLKFCNDNLRLKRVWGIAARDNLLAHKAAEGLLELEGTARGKEFSYYGHIFD